MTDTATVVEYRTFRNSDPPQLLQLWHRAGLGRGAARGLPIDLFDNVLFAQTYFDREGLIVAHEGTRLVGFVHAGFASDNEGRGLDQRMGVVCAVIVDPEFRRRGIGRQLVYRAEQFLRSHGAGMIQAGPSFPADPFYFGIYGGAQPAGFLESDPLAHPFFEALGYVALRRQLIYHKDLSKGSDPVTLRLMSARRATRLVSRPDSAPHSWYWTARLGRLEALDLELQHKVSGQVVAHATLVSLDAYFYTWQTRAIGLVDIEVPEADRRKGYGQTLLTELCRHVRGDMVEVVEAHAPEGNSAATNLLESVGFTQVDAGIVYLLQAER